MKPTITGWIDGSRARWSRNNCNFKNTLRVTLCLMLLFLFSMAKYNVLSVRRPKSSQYAFRKKTLQYGMIYSKSQKNRTRKTIKVHEICHSNWYQERIWKNISPASGKHLPDKRELLAQKKARVIKLFDDVQNWNHCELCKKTIVVCIPQDAPPSILPLIFSISKNGETSTLLSRISLTDWWNVSFLPLAERHGNCFYSSCSLPKTSNFLPLFQLSCLAKTFIT